MRVVTPRAFARTERHGAVCADVIVGEVQRRNRPVALQHVCKRRCAVVADGVVRQVCALGRERATRGCARGVTEGRDGWHFGQQARQLFHKLVVDAVFGKPAAAGASDPTPWPSRPGHPHLSRQSDGARATRRSNELTSAIVMPNSARW
jgi:hypothetical protein